MAKRQQTTADSQSRFSNLSVCSLDINATWNKGTFDKPQGPLKGRGDLSACRGAHETDKIYPIRSAHDMYGMKSDTLLYLQCAMLSALRGSGLGKFAHLNSLIWSPQAASGCGVGTNPQSQACKGYADKRMDR
ncbi:predicted protein [Coccidioides posadasii str. Silveira]|uniref:Predicted protein n=1 Tax=Coccidioides posadasii (strain RMSCC 757 / Silveira) TaxID=443226 RepID=E9DD26_COCPS|nr:predicted protein [Coccidioides posadasii str. Silveira]